MYNFIRKEFFSKDLKNWRIFREAVFWGYSTEKFHCMSVYEKDLRSQILMISAVPLHIEIAAKCKHHIHMIQVKIPTEVREIDNEKIDIIPFV